MPGQLLRDDAIEFLSDDAPVEGVHFEPDFVGRVHGVDLARARIEDFELLVYSRKTSYSSKSRTSAKNSIPTSEAIARSAESSSL